MSGFEFCTMYRTCKRCGAYHDDGTWDLCMDCLEAEEKATAAENETTTDDDHSCATCEWYTDGRCLKDCEKHEWFDYCLNHKPKAATANDHFRETTKNLVR